MKDFHDFAMQLLWWKKGAFKHDYALLFNLSGAFVGCARSSLDSNPITGTAVVNLLQSAIGNKVNVDQAWIYTTSPPTEACKGMARLQTRGGAIIYPDSGRKIYLADRRNPRLVQGIEHALSDDSAAWAVLARNNASLTDWFAAVKGEKLKDQKVKGLTDLAPKAAAAAKKVESLSAWTERSANTLTKFFEPKALGKFDLVPTLSSDSARDEFFTLLAQELVHSLGGRTREAKVSDVNVGHNIGSVMVDSQWQVVGWGVNTNATNGTFHGETNTVQAYESSAKQTLPVGGTLYTSLEPCEMCAGVIRRGVAPNDKAFRVLYIQSDDTLNDTALRDKNSPVKMEAAKAVIAQKLHGFEQGRSFGLELSARQKTLVKTVGKAFLAPTKFLKEKDALDVFKLAGQQRLDISTPLAKQMAETHAKTLGHSAAVDFRTQERKKLAPQLGSGRNASQLAQFGTRDDMALLKPMGTHFHEQLHHHTLLQQRLTLHGKSTLPLKDLKAIGSLDDSVLLAGPKGWDDVDPHLIWLRIELDKLSAKFQTFLKSWMDTHADTVASKEKLRLLKQVTDFLTLAATSVKK